MYNGRKVIENSATQNMYYQNITNFRHSVSITSTTFTKQHVRFNRNCQKIFNQDKSHHAKSYEINDRLACANRQKFLFFFPQNINSPIKYLNYKECNSQRINYLFPIPINSSKVIRNNGPSTSNALAFTSSHPNSTSKEKMTIKPAPSTYYDSNSFDHKMGVLLKKYYQHINFMKKLES
ncbi:unnamed protein product [Rhizophagus irregularis]|nr:unnamed protein product [Rhizophagus irregularis]